MTSYSIAMSHGNIKTFAGQIDLPGKKSILQSLNQTGKAPIQSILDIQQTMSIGNERSQPAMQFLDVLGLSRCTTHSSILESLKDKLLLSIEDLDQNSLLVLLKETCQFMCIRDLKSIPVTIFKRLQHVPEKYLEFLLDKKYHSDFSSSMRRQAWEKNIERFVLALDEMCSPLSDSNAVQRAVSGVVDVMGDSELLFAAFAKFCNDQQLLRSTHSADASLWGSLLLDVRVEMHRLQQRDHKVAKTDRVSDFVSLVDRCRRQNRMDGNDIVSISVMLKALVVAQSSALEKDYLLTHPNAQLELLFPVRSAAAVSEGSKKRKAGDDAGVWAKRLREAVQFLLDLDVGRVFYEPVTDSMAPDYSRIIRRPMSLSVVKAKLRSSRYSSPEELDEDVQLIFRNCAQYNGPDSEYTQMANAYRVEWKSYLRKMLAGADSSGVAKQTRGGAEEPMATPLESVASTSRRTSVSERGVSTAFPGVQRTVDKMLAILSGVGSPEKRVSKCLVVALDFLATLDHLALFAQPVTDEVAPNYSQVIARPMSFATLKARILSTECADLEAFGSDIQQIVANCLEYNAGYEPFIKEARRLRDGWQALRDKVQTACPQLAQSSERVDVEAGDSGDSRGSSAPLVLAEADFQAALGDVDRQSAEGLQLGLRLLWELATALDTEGFFAAPVEAEGYAAVVRSPMDLSLVKLKLDRRKYRSLDSFEVDLRMIVSNCLAFNEPHSHVSQCAERLRLGYEASIQKFRSVINPPGNVQSAGDGSVACSPEVNETESAVESVELESTAQESGLAASEQEPQITAQMVTESGLAASDQVVTESGLAASNQVPLVIETGLAGSEKHGRDGALEEFRSSDAQENKPAVSSQQIESVVETFAAVRPSAQAALQSSREAVETLRTSSRHELPAVIADGPLLWVLAMARDLRVQTLLVALLASRLFDSAVDSLERCSKALLMALADPAQPTLPQDDPILPAVLQLCQLSFVAVDHSFHPVSQVLLRYHLPALVHALFSNRAALKSATVALRGGSLAAQAKELVSLAQAELASSAESERLVAFLETLTVQLLRLNAKT